MISCPLCFNEHPIDHSIIRSIQYFKCNDCNSIFKHSKHRLTPEDEKRHYLTHNNDVNDLRYQNFVSPIIHRIKERFNKKTIGLDFGAGTGPVITKLLRDDGYQLELYDPFFHPDRIVLSKKFDYIICCEVIEHFYDPNTEFKFLKKLLKPGGSLILKTEFIPDDRPFSEWYYIIDPTHVFFYTPESFDWVKEYYSFKSVSVEGRIIELIS